MSQVTPRFGLAALLLSALLTLIAAVPAPAAQAAVTPAPVYLPTERPFGKSYGDWAALWGQWFFRVPRHKDANDPSKGILHPNFETTGATCAVGQSGPVFFLASLRPDTANAMRHCTVPAGKALLLPVTAGICSNLPGERKSVADLKAECRNSLDIVTEASVEIDGAAVPNVLTYRAQSRAFSYRIPKDDCCFLAALGARPGTYWPAIAEGHVVMIKPLSPGQHIIRYREHSPLASPPVQATYILTVR